MNPLLIILSIFILLLLAVVLLIFFGSASIRITFSGQLKLVFSFLGFRFPVFPLQIDNPRAEKFRKKLAKRKKAYKAEKKEQKSAGKPVPNMIDDLQMIIALIKTAYHRLQGKLSIHFRRFHIRVASNDASKTAIIYGAVLGTSSLLLEWVDSNFSPIQREVGDIQVIADYLTDKPDAEIDIELGMKLYQAISVTTMMFSAYKDERTRAYAKAKRRAAKKANRRKKAAPAAPQTVSN